MSSLKKAEDDFQAITDELGGLGLLEWNYSY